MKCSEFKEWFLDSETSGAIAQAAEEHLNNCPDCQRLSELDHRLDAILKSSIEQEEVPSHLHAQLYLNLEQNRKNRQFTSAAQLVRYWLPALAAAALLLFFINPLQLGKITSFEDLSRLALQDHQYNLAMAFDAAEVKDVPSWFAKHTGLKIRMPALHGKGYKFIGGRKCTLGACSAAYLLYKKGGKRVSLFIIDEKNITFMLEPVKNYAMTTENNTITIWKENNQVLAMVI